MLKFSPLLLDFGFVGASELWFGFLARFAWLMMKKLFVNACYVFQSAVGTGKLRFFFYEIMLIKLGIPCFFQKLKLALPPLVMEFLLHGAF